MKLYKPVIAAVAALLLFFAYSWDRSRVVSSTAEASPRLISFDSEAASYLEVTNLSGTYVVERKDDGEWWLTSPVEMRANENAVSVIIDNLLGQRRGIAFGVDNLEDYGLDDPLPTITVRGTDLSGSTEEFEIHLGADANQMGLIYAKMAGETDVFTLYDLVRKKAGVDIDNLRDNRMLLIDSANVAAIDIIQGIDDAFRLERDGSDWFIPEFAIPASSGRVTSTLDQTTQLRGMKFFDDPTSGPAELGLDPSVVSVYFELTDGSLHELSFGNLIPNRDWIYAASSYQESPAIVRSAVVAELLKPAVEYGTRRFIWADSDDIVRVETSTGSSSMELVKDKSGEWTFEDFPDATIHDRKLNQFLEALGQFTAESLIDENIESDERVGRYGLRDQSYQVRVTTRDGEVQGFHFGSTALSEGIAYVARIQDDTLWSIDADRPHFVRALRGDLMDRRIAPNFSEGTDEIIFTMMQSDPRAKFTITRKDKVWVMRSENQNAAIIPDKLVQDFLEATEDLEYDSVSVLMSETTNENATFMMEFFSEGEKTHEIVDIVPGRTMLTSKGVFDVDAESLSAMRTAWAVMQDAAEITN